MLWALIGGGGWTLFCQNREITGSLLDLTGRSKSLGVRGPGLHVRMLRMNVWHACKGRMHRNRKLSSLGWLASQILSLWMGPLGFSQAPTHNRDHAFADLLSAAADTVGHSTI